MSRRALKLSLSSGFLLMTVSLLLWSRRDLGYTVLSHDSRYAVSSFKLSRGHDHEMWDADPAEMMISRWLGKSAFTRRIRFKLLSPIPWFRTQTPEPSLAFIVRLKGDVSDAPFAGLTAQLFSGTNVYDLKAQASSRNTVRQSQITCWILQSTPATNRPLELRVSSSSGEVARIAIPAHRPEFSRPLVAPDQRKSRVAHILNSFVQGQTPADETLRSLHELYEEYRAPEFLTPFEMLYHDPTGEVAGEPAGTLATRLRTQALDWLEKQSRP